ncbi:hypothetical protein, partial [Mycolicibacterium cosmeticum]|uniref:hypothetical protein n=1 Tax=Mycolicibacterium cosmeticum TaxID=258533 RepID=UPI0032048631
KKPRSSSWWLDLRGKRKSCSGGVRQMTNGATTSQTFRPCQGLVSASRATVDEGFDQRLEALGGLIAAPENSDVDQWHQEPDESDYVHVIITSYDESRTPLGSAASESPPVGGHEKGRVDEPGR